MRALSSVLGFILLFIGNVSFAAFPESLSFNGDLRYRHESRQVEGQRYRPWNSFRVRFNALTKVNDTTEAKLQFTSGDGQPRGMNQKLSDGFSKKPFNISLAYIDWKPMAGGQVHAGKVPLPLYKPGNSDLIFDHDVTPEGVAVKYEMGSTWKPFFSAFNFWLKEDSGGDDAHLVGGQVGVKSEMGSHKMSLELARYSYLGAKGSAAFYSGYENNNTVSGGLYSFDYDINEVGFDYALSTAWGPLSLCGQYVFNSAIDTDNTGYYVGVGLGSTKNVGDFKFDLNYRHIEKDAAVGVFIDSDFAGGKTDSNGSKVRVAYKMAENSFFALSHFVNKNSVSTSNPSKFDKTMFDFWVTY